MTFLKNFRLYVAFLCLVGTTAQLQAQQEALYSMYMFNGLVINPAYAGSHSAPTVTAQIREQWAGFQGAPSSQNITAHMPLPFTRTSLGFMISNDKVGVTGQTGLQGIYAYRVPMGKGQLSMGLQGGITIYNSELTSLNIVSGGNNADIDPSFAQDMSSGILPNFGAGLYYHTSNYYVGFSIPHLINNSLENINELMSVVQERHYFLSAGYVFDVGLHIKVKPNVLVKAVPGAPFQTDFNTNVLLKELIWIGASYRTSGTAAAIMEINITKEMSFGYAYDFAISEGAQNVRNGSHEFMLSYRIKNRKDLYLTPRYF
jgi:type IX secretion system PorP/SprF family membrane protein